MKYNEREKERERMAVKSLCFVTRHFYPFNNDSKKSVRDTQGKNDDLR